MTKDMETFYTFVRLKLLIASMEWAEWLFLRGNILDLPQEGGLLGCKPMGTHIDANANLWNEISPQDEDVS